MEIRFAFHLAALCFILFHHDVTREPELIYLFIYFAGNVFTVFYHSRIDLEKVCQSTRFVLILK